MESLSGKLFAMPPRLLVALPAMLAAGRRGLTEQAPRPGMEIRNGWGIVSIIGYTSKRPDAILEIEGGTILADVREDLRAATESPATKDILLYLDSGGGGVDGVQELHKEILALRGKGKRIYAYTDGRLTGSAYWLAAAAEKIFISGGTTQVGGIGVVALHRDVSKMEEMVGIKTSEIVAGRYKRIASQYKPLSDEGRRDIQEKLDFVHTAFINDVAAARGLDPTPRAEGTIDVLPAWADGKVFLGEKAIKAGLADGVASLEEIIGGKSLPSVKTGKKASAAGAADANLTPEARAERVWKYDPEIREEFHNNFAAFMAWEKNKHRVRIVGRKQEEKNG